MPDTLAINAARKGNFIFFDIGGGMNNVAFKVDSYGRKAPGYGLSARLGYRYFFAPNREIGVGVIERVLPPIIVFLKKNPDVVKMEVSAHTDNIGSDAYNLDLSKRRARTVVNYLIKQGVEPERVVAVGYGESRPLNDNSTDEMREINRRVEFVILALDDTKKPKKKEDE